MHKYKINEIFYSLQGEGFWTGTPSIFIRFSGCNLRCPFCDTQHEEGQSYAADEIMAIVQKYPATHVVLTGGEPSLFVDDALINALHSQGKFIAIETNGTHPLPETIDWITLSPKDGVQPNAHPILPTCNEIKLVFDGNTPILHEKIKAQWHYLQPCDTGDSERNAEILKATIAFIKANPQWRLSLQTHKFIGIR